MTFLLCAGFMVWFIMAFRALGVVGGADWRALGALLMVGSIGAVFYIAVFLPHFFLGWWAGSPTCSTTTAT